MSTTIVTLAELAAHNSKQDLWIAVHGRVYDLAPFATDHPGGIDILLECAGTDASEAYEYAGHSEEATVSLQRFCVGQLKGQVITQTPAGRSEKKDWSIATENSSQAVHILKDLAQSALKPLLLLATVGAIAVLLPQILNLLVVYQPLKATNISPNITSSFWALLVVVAGFGGAFIYLYQQFVKTLHHTKEPFEYPSTIPRPAININMIDI